MRRISILILASFLCVLFPLSILHAAEPDNTKINSVKRPLTIASSNNFPPINTLDDKGQLIGFAREISSAVAKAIGVEVTYIHSGIWTDVLKWLANGKADLIHDTGYTAERESYLDFSDPILEMPESIFVRGQQFDINSFSSLYGKKVACVNRHITHIYLQKFKKIQCHLVNTPAEGLIALINGNVEAFIYPEQIVLYLAQKLQLSNKIKVTGKPLRVLSWSMTVKDGNKELLKQLNQGIKAVKASGEYQVIYNKWFGKRLFYGYSKIEVIIIVVLSILISLILFLIIYLKREHKIKIQLRKEKEKAEDANTAKTQFISSMSHEFRTPMNSVLGFSQLLMMEATDEKTKDNIQEIMNAGSHLLELVNQILEISKIESGKIALTIDSHILSEMINDSLSLIKPIADERSVEIDNKIELMQIFRVNIDKAKFQQVLLNLLSNAIKYNHEKGKVTINCMTTKEHMLCLSIYDTGEGLTPEQQQHLFIPFDRAGAENSDIRGTGLGLVIAKDLIEQMKGTIGFESEVGKGSRFWIQVPLS